MEILYWTRKGDLGSRRERPPTKWPTKEGQNMDKQGLNGDKTLWTWNRWRVRADLNEGALRLIPISMNLFSPFCEAIRSRNFLTLCAHGYLIFSASI
jgi:hypothetical protein